MECAIRDWAKANPERAALLNRLENGALPDDFDQGIPEFGNGKEIATRKARVSS